MARVRPNNDEGPLPEGSPRRGAVFDGETWEAQAQDTGTNSTTASDFDRTPPEMADIVRHGEGTHRRSRVDTLESSDGETGPFGTNRGALKTYEQLRSLHPEKGFRNDDASIEQRGGLATSITTDIKKYVRRTCSATWLKLKRRKEQGLSDGVSFKNWLDRLPFLIALRKYRKDMVGGDLAAGLAEGIVCIPMGMSYALLANIPPVYGLYTSLLPPFMYLLFGTCDQLSLGVSAIESLLTAAGVSKVIGWVNDEIDENTTQEDIDTKVAVTITFTLCVGVWHMVMRMFGVGAIATFLSDPVLSGFSTASAFLIGTSQLKHLVGYDLPKSTLPVIWIEAVTNVPNYNMVAFMVGLGGIFSLWVFKKANQRYLPDIPLPSQVVVVILATLVTYLFDWEHTADLKILGEIPSGLPAFRLPSFPHVEGIGGISVYGSNLAIQSLLVALMTYIITISIGKTFARLNQNKYKIDGDQELVAMSSANLIGSLFQTYPASASLSRTAVVQSISCNTRMHSVPAVLVVMLVLIAITPLLYTLPKSILGSVVIFGVVKMVDFRDARRLYHLSKPDFALWNVSFWVTVLVGPIEGIAASVSVSLLYLLLQTSRPANSILGRLPETREYRNVKRFPMAKEIPGIRIFRFDSSLHFANKDYFENRLKALEDEPCEGTPIHTIVLDASSINQLDASAIDMLILVAKSYQARGVSILCANWKGPQRDLLELSGFYDVIPPANLFLGLHDAVVEARKRSRYCATVAQPEPAPVSTSPEETRNEAVAEPRDAETVVEIGPDGGTRQWRVGAVEINPEGKVEREWGLGRV